MKEKFFYVTSTFLDMYPNNCSWDCHFAHGTQDKDRTCVWVTWHCPRVGA